MEDLTMMILRFKNEDSCNEILSKIRKMRVFAEDLEECIEKATEESSYDETRRQDYGNDYNDNYDNNSVSRSGMTNRYYYPRR